MAERYDEELILGFVEGELTPEQTRRFEELLVEDARLRNLVAHLVLDRNRLRHMPREQAPPGLMEQVDQHLERHMLMGNRLGGEDPAAPARRFHINRYLAYSGLAAMLILSGLLVVHTLNNPGGLNLTAPPKGGGGAAAHRGVAHEAAPFQSDAIAEKSPQADPLEMSGEKRLASAAQKKENEIAELTMRDKTREIEGKAEPAFAKPGAGGTAAPPLPRQAEPAASPRALEKDVAPPAAQAQTPAVPKHDLVFPLVQNGAGKVAEAPGVRLEITSLSPLASEKDVMGWASRNNAQVLPSAAEVEQPAAEARASQSARVAEDVAKPRQVVIVLATRQVPQLVGYLNNQRGQTAGLTQAVATRQTSLGSPAAKDSAGPAGANQLQEAVAATTQPDAQTAPADQAAAYAGLGDARADQHAAAEQATQARVQLPAEALVSPANADAPVKLEVLIQDRGVTR